jgi:hypothetical protein
MAYDGKKNFVYATVAIAPSPQTTGTTISLSNALAARFPDPAVVGQYNPTIWPANQDPLDSNAEIVRFTAKGAPDSGGAGYTQFTMIRTQEDSATRSIQVGDQIALNITKKWFDDLETNKLERSSNLSDLTNTTTARTNLNAQNKVFYTVGQGASDDYVCDGVADDVQIQQAISAANTAGGGTVFVKEGLYDTTATITIPRNCYELRSNIGITWCSIKQAKATKCSAATVSGNRS